MGRPTGSAVFYKEIAEKLTKRIRQGKWPEGMLLPSYSQLADTFKTSVTTIVRAIAHMEHEGRIVQTPLGKWKVSASSQAIDLYANRVVLIATHNLAEFWTEKNPSYRIRKEVEMSLSKKLLQLQVINRYQYNKKINSIVIPKLAEDMDVYGIILLGIFTKQCQRAYGELRQHVVMIDAPPATDKISSVCVENEAGAMDAVQRLAHLGHRRIIFCRRILPGISEVDPDSTERQQGFLSGLKSCGISNGKDAIYNFFGKDSSDASTLLAIFSARPRYTAAIVVDGGIGESLKNAASSSGLIVPQNFSIACFSEPGSIWGGPRPNFEQMGREAVHLLTSREIKQLRIPTVWYDGSTLSEPIPPK